MDDLQTVVDRLVLNGYSLVGGIGEYEHMWRMTYVREPEGIIVALAQRIDLSRLVRFGDPAGRN